MNDWPIIQKGYNALEQASADWHDYIVVTTKSPWELARHCMPDPNLVIFVTNLDRSKLDSLKKEATGASLIVGLGSGLSMDATKFLAKANGMNMAQIPTTSSNNACFTRTAWTFEGDKRIAEREVPIPTQIVLDYDLIRQAPNRMNQAGSAEILCSHTALFDWKLANRAGVDVQWDDKLESITRIELERLQHYSDSIGRAELDSFVEIIEVGRKFADGFTSHPKARFNAGSEHILAWAIEQMADVRIIHGEAVSLSILIMSHIQNNNPEIVSKIIQSTKMLYLPEDIGTSWDQVEKIITYLPEFSENIPWHTIITEFAKRGSDGRRELMNRFKAAKLFVQSLK